jgi:hypothetical protein
LNHSEFLDYKLSGLFTFANKFSSQKNKMKDKNRNITLNKMRSYSSVFSSTYFSKLLQHDDYSFIDSKILQYDYSKVGISIDTYYDYIKYIYNELSKQYRSEYVYKNTFINELLIKSYGVKDTVAINEFRVGNSIADIVLFNGTSKAFEIKTELDSNKRLNGQLTDYRKIFKESYIVTHESLIDKYLKEDDSVGLIVLEEHTRSLKMVEVRPAKVNLQIDSETIIRSIRTNEYKGIVKKYYGELPIMNSFNMFDICNDLLRQMPPNDLNKLFIEQLKKRKSNTIKIDSFFKELRQIGLAMNIDERTHQSLINKLNKPIVI